MPQLPALLVFSANPFVFHTTEPLKVPHHCCLPLPSMCLFEVSQHPSCPSQWGHGRVAWGTSLLQHREDATLEVLPSPANSGGSQGRRNSGVLLLGMTQDLSLLKRTVFLLPPAEATDPDLHSGLLMAQCVLAVGKTNNNNNKPPNKERNNFLPQSAQRPCLVRGCALAPSWYRVSVPASRGGLRVGHYVTKSYL